MQSIQKNSCLWKMLGLLQHISVGKDPEVQPGIQVAAMWGNSHRSGLLLACLAGSGFTGHGITWTYCFTWA